MAQEPLPEPQVTQDQFDLDSSNADLTHGMIHRSLGRQDAFRAAHVPWEMLVHYEMVFIPQPEEGEEDGRS